MKNNAVEFGLAVLPDRLPPRPLRPCPSVAGPATSPGGIAVNLSTVTFADGHGVAIAHNGVVTPNHPDMVWLMQSAAVPGPELAPPPHASRRPKLRFTRR